MESKHMFWAYGRRARRNINSLHACPTNCPPKDHKRTRWGFITRCIHSEHIWSAIHNLATPRTAPPIVELMESSGGGACFSKCNFTIPYPEFRIQHDVHASVWGRTYFATCFRIKWKRIFNEWRGSRNVDCQCDQDAKGASRARQTSRI